jgi:hypothetical protein
MSGPLHYVDRVAYQRRHVQERRRLLTRYVGCQDSAAAERAKRLLAIAEAILADLQRLAEGRA